MEYKVKGSSLRSKLQFVREKFGDEAEAELRTLFDRKQFPILDSSWYPFELYEAVNRTIVERHLGGDVTRLREVGEFSAEKVLTSVYRFFTTGQDFVGFLKRAESLHQTCYNEGGMRVDVGEDGRSCHILLTAPRFSETDLHIAAGFYSGAGRLLGARDITCRCHHDREGAHFHLTWS
jgi:hypothetical protein